MKKTAIILGIILFSGVSAYVLAEEITVDVSDTEPVKNVSAILPPKWEEFCEPGYEYVTAPGKDNILSVVNFVKSEREKKTYWAGRREAFEKYLSHCKTISDAADRGVCYSELRHLENDKNELYNTKRKQILYQNANFVK